MLLKWGLCPYPSSPAQPLPPFTQESSIFSSWAGGYERQEKACYVGQAACGVLTRSHPGRKLELLITFFQDDSLFDLKVTL